MEETIDVVIGVLKVFNFDVYVLLDLGANPYFVTPFLGNRFNLCLEVLFDPFEVCTPLGELVVTMRVDRGCFASILHKIIHCDLVKLTIIDFDVIHGIDWLHASYASIDY